MSELGRLDVEGGYTPHQVFGGETSRSSSTVHVKMPDGLLSAVQSIVQGGRWPYRTQQEMIRDAVHHRIRWLMDNDPETMYLFEDQMRLWEAEQKLGQLRQLHETMDKVVEEVEDRAVWIRKQGDRADRGKLRDDIDMVLAVQRLSGPMRHKLEAIREEMGHGK